VLEIEPPIELTFTGPFTSAVSSVMKLGNPSEKRVCFKIRTTAPKRYCVKPNSGVIDPRQTVTISVSLQPFEFDPSERNRHKFMVQSMFAPDGEINQDTLWKESDPTQLMDSKLKCVFKQPDTEMMNNRDDINNSSDFQRQAIPPSPKNLAEGNDMNLRKTVEEIKKLQEEVSQLRQENIQLKEEALRQKRLAANRDPDSASSGFSSSSSGGVSSTVVSASNPNATALSTTYMYAALVVLILGIIVGKWIL